MEKSLYTTLQLASCLLAIVAVAWLIMKYLTPKCSGSDKVPEDGASSAKSCRIHLCYLVGIGSLLLIEFVSYILTHTGQFSGIFDQISLAATISSILLSVIAIIYSIVSGTNGANLYVKTEEVSKQIGETLPKFADLEGAIVELKKIPSDIASHLSELRTQMEHMEELSSGVSQKVDKVASDISAMSEPLGGIFYRSRSTKKGHFSEGDTKKDRQAKSHEDLFRGYIRNSSLAGLLILLACCYSSENKKSIVMKEDPFGMEGFSSDYFLGYLVASRALGIIKATRVEKNRSVKIDSVYDGFDVKGAVVDALQECLDKGPYEGSVKDHIREWIENIKSYFDVSDE